MTRREDWFEDPTQEAWERRERDAFAERLSTPRGPGYYAMLSPEVARMVTDQTPIANVVSANVAHALRSEVNE